MRRNELIQAMLSGDIEAAAKVIYDDQNGREGKYTRLFKQLAGKIFHIYDDHLWEIIRSQIFELITRNDCHSLKTIKKIDRFDIWLLKTATNYCINKNNKQLVLALAGYTTQAELYTAPKEDDDSDPENDVLDNSVLEGAELEAHVGIRKLSEIFQTDSYHEIVERVLKQFEVACSFDRASINYAYVIRRKIVDQVPAKIIATEIGVSHKNMSIIITRAMTQLAKFTKNLIKRYGQE